MYIRNVIFTLSAALLTVSVANAAEYVVQRGDTVAHIAAQTGHTVDQIVAMNGGPSLMEHALEPGTTVTVVTQDDWDDARQECWYRYHRTSASWRADSPYVYCAANMPYGRMRLRYTEYGDGGMYFADVLSLADAWRDQYHARPYWQERMWNRPQVEIWNYHFEPRRSSCPRWLQYRGNNRC